MRSIKVSFPVNNMEEHACRLPERIKGKLVWAPLPGIPNRMRWPVKVIELPIVYSNCDNAWLRLKTSESELEEFPSNYRKWKCLAEKTLKKKPDTLLSFFKDVEWAFDLVKNQEKSDTGSNESDQSTSPHVGNEVSNKGLYPKETTTSKGDNESNERDINTYQVQDENLTLSKIENVPATLESSDTCSDKNDQRTNPRVGNEVSTKGLYPKKTTTSKGDYESNERYTNTYDVQDQNLTLLSKIENNQAILESSDNCSDKSVQSARPPAGNKVSTKGLYPQETAKSKGDNESYKRDTFTYEARDQNLNLSKIENKQAILESIDTSSDKSDQSARPLIGKEVPTKGLYPKESTTNREDSESDKRYNVSNERDTYTYAARDQNLTLLSRIENDLAILESSDTSYAQSASPHVKNDVPSKGLYPKETSTSKGDNESNKGSTNTFEALDKKLTLLSTIENDLAILTNTCSDTSYDQSASLHVGIEVPTKGLYPRESTASRGDNDFDKRDNNTHEGLDQILTLLSTIANDQAILESSDTCSDKNDQSTSRSVRFEVSTKGPYPKETTSKGDNVSNEEYTNTNEVLDQNLTLLSIIENDPAILESNYTSSDKNDQSARPCVGNDMLTKALYPRETTTNEGDNESNKRDTNTYEVLDQNLTFWSKIENVPVILESNDTSYDESDQSTSPLIGKEVPTKELYPKESNTNSGHSESDKRDTYSDGRQESPNINMEILSNLQCTEHSETDIELTNLYLGQKISNIEVQIILESSEDNQELDANSIRRKTPEILKSSESEILKKEHVKIKSEADDSDCKFRKKQKLSEECIFFSDSGSDTNQSEIFPFLQKKMLKLSKQAESDSEDSDSSDQEQSRVTSRDVKNSNIYVSCAEKSVFTKLGKRKITTRKYNARHMCPFCKVKVTNFSHHIQAKKHEEEEEIKKLNCINDVSERKQLITKLRLNADNENNINVIKEKKGEIFLLRRFIAEHSESEDSDSENEENVKSFDVTLYGPCPNCKGWVIKKSMRKHYVSCITLKTVSWTNRALEVQSDIIAGKLTSEASQALISEVYPIMKGDATSKVAQQDELIINLGNQWLMRNRGNTIMRKYYTSSIMRLTAKLKVACQKLSNTSMDMTSYLAPKYFETVLKGALTCCHIDDLEEDLKAPSNAIKLGFDIKRMLNAKISKAIIDENDILKKEATDFLKLMEIEWSLRVTKLARGLLVQQSYNKKTELPKPSDIKKLYEYLVSELRQLDLSDVSFDAFHKAAVLSLSRLTLYNRRRCHEVQAMRLSSYASRKVGVDEVGLEVRQELTEFELHLLTKQEVVIIRGKTGRGVPVILPEDTKNVLNYLTNQAVRQDVGIQDDNPYVFANKGAGVFRAYDAIRQLSQAPEANLRMPHLIRTSNMRKYMATMLQALNTTEAERQWVLDHLGHTMDVHRVHYRQTSDVLERVDVAKILLIQDMGLVSKFRGKRLEDIQLEDVFTEDKSLTELEPSTSSSHEELNTSDVTDLINNDIEEEDEYIPDMNSADTEDEDGEKLGKRKRPSKAFVRQRWSEVEVSELLLLFASEFTTNSLPGQKKIEKMMRKSKENNGVIHKRKRDTIKKKLSNMMLKQKHK